LEPTTPVFERFTFMRALDVAITGIGSLLYMRVKSESMNSSET